MIDPTNPVAKLCGEGMQAEAAGRWAEARSLFEQAWAARTNDYEAAIAAHYVARQQPTPEEALRWNEIALDAARAVKDGSADGFYASLYLNVGKSHEDLGALGEARRYYVLAAKAAEGLPDDPYGQVVRGGIARGLARTAEADEP